LAVVFDGVWTWVTDSWGDLC